MGNENYLEKYIDATITYEKEKIEIMFHRAKVKLHDEREIHLLRSVNPEFNKIFLLTDDQLTINIFQPDTYQLFDEIHNKSTQSRWQFAYNLIRHVNQHSIPRLHLVVCPENILFDQGLMPHFLHYGIKESIPPYEDDKERLWNETKAIIAAIADKKYTFHSYLSHYETIELSPVTKQIMDADSYETLLAIVDENLKKDDAYEKTVVHIPQKRWKFNRYTALTLAILIIPAFLFTVYAFFFEIPEKEAYVESNRYFLQNQYSSVVDTLEGYKHENMPYSVQYQLASAYLVNESLTDEQRANVQNTITLQSDGRYFLYWINIGRGNELEAIDIARLLEDRDLIVYGLLKQREAVKVDVSLSGEEREEQLGAIQQEVDEYLQEIEEEEEEKQAEETEAEQEENQVEETTENTSENN